MNWLEWIGVILTPAVIAAIVTGGMNYLNSERQIRANTVSKARIEWMQSFRVSASSYISALLSYINFVGAVDIQKSWAVNDLNPQQQLDKTVELLKEINGAQTMLKLYLPVIDGDSNKGNENIRNKMDDIDKLMLKYNESVSKETREELDSAIGEFMDLVSLYLKSEWKTVKNIK